MRIDGTYVLMQNLQPMPHRGSYVFPDGVSSLGEAHESGVTFQRFHTQRDREFFFGGRSEI
jgi:hypothetical protein